MSDSGRGTTRMEGAERAIARAFTRPRCVRFASAVIGTVLCTALLSYARGAKMVDASNTIVGADFSAFYIGGRLLHDGREHALYDYKVQKAEHDALIAPARSPDFHPYVNPPFYAVVMEPLAALPYRTALALWWTASGAALLLVLFALRREFTALSARPYRELVRMALLFYPTLVCLLFGQNSVFTLALLALWLLGLRRGRDFWGGVACGLLLYKPQLALGPVLIALTQRRWRVLAGAALGASGWLAVGMVGAPHAMRTYLHVAPWLFEFISGPEYPVWGLASLYGFGVMLLGEFQRGWGKALGYALTAAGALTIVLSWWRARWKPGSRDWDLRMAGTIALSLVTSPHLYYYDALLLILPFALLLAHHTRSERLPLDGGPLLAYSGLMYVGLVIGPILCHELRALLRSFDLVGAVPQLATCAIVLWAVALLRAASPARSAAATRKLALPEAVAS